MIENVPKAMNPEFHECVNPAQQLGVVFYCFYKVCAEELPFGMDFTDRHQGHEVSRTTTAGPVRVQGVILKSVERLCPG